MPSKHDVTKASILTAGLKMFLRRGFAGAGLTEILRTAKIPRGSFYHYFRSKEDFAVAIVEHAASRHLAEIESFLADRDRTPRERLAAYLEHLVAHHAEHGHCVDCIVPKLALEASQLSESIRAALAEAAARLTTTFERPIAEGLSDGSFPAVAPAPVLARALVSTLQGATIRMAIDDDVEPLREACDVWLDGILAARA